jgi:prepilin-type N-terminal cleavage/methylation domain-containing protein
MVARLKGFTLVEVLIALGALGVLLALATAFYRDFVSKARVDEAVGVAQPVMLALGEACIGRYLDGADHAKLGLPATTSYETPKVVQSILAEGLSAQSARITVTMKAFGDVTAGSTLVYAGACSAMGLRWSVDPSSTLAAKFLPKA